MGFSISSLFSTKVLSLLRPLLPPSITVSDICFERERQFNKAEAVYEYMATFNSGFKDIMVKLTRAKGLSETVMLGGGGAHPGGTVLLAGGAVDKPMLGRYQIEKELGKGCHGQSVFGERPKNRACGCH